MVDIKNSSITDILPENFKYDPKVMALGYALGKAVKRVCDYADKTSLFASIDTLPEDIIDILAIELRTQYYDESMPLEQKRELVKNTMPWYNRAGTTGAVQEMVNTVFGTGRVLEWYDTDDAPGTFKISTPRTINPDLVALFNSVVDNVKNVRSHLSGLIVGNRVDFTLNHAIGVAKHEVKRVTN